MAPPGFRWLLGGGKRRQEKTVFTDSSLHSSSDLGFLGVRETEIVKFPTVKGPKVSSSASQRKVKKKWQSREERRIDKEYDAVLVPSDGVCLSGSESDDSDWSIGWLEPHGSDFLSDDETDDSFAVLVPCYRNDRKGIGKGPDHQLLSAIKNLTNQHFNVSAVESEVELLREALRYDKKARLSWNSGFLLFETADKPALCPDHMMESTGQ